MMRFLVINGPNLDLLGRREPETYGTETLTDLEAMISKWAGALGVEVTCSQSNHEGEIIELIARPTPLPGDLADWLETFGESFILAVAEPDRASYIAEVVDALRPELHTESGGWVADYVRLRFTATAN